MTWRMWAAAALVTVAVTPAAFVWWLLHSIKSAIERINPS